MIETRELFFVAPFGRKSTLLDKAPEIDFDDVYDALIKEAAASVGWSAKRGDELFKTGGLSIIDEVMGALFRADVVIADVTTANANVFYELGVRHAVAAGGTLLIAHANTALPFDIAHWPVLFYELTEPALFRTKLASWLKDYAGATARRSDGRPAEIRTSLERLGIVTGSSDELRFEQDFAARLERADNQRQLVAVWHWARQHERLPSRLLGELAKRLHRDREWNTAAEVLARATRDSPDDFELRRSFGWTLGKLGKEDAAETELRRAVDLNGSDPEAWGMLGGLFKKQKRFGEAVDAYHKSLQFVRDDEYVLVNLACVEVLVGGERRAAGIERYRALGGRMAARAPIDRDVWTDLTEGEAAFVTADDKRARKLYVAARDRPGVTWELDSAAKQLELFAAADYRAGPARELAGVLREGPAKATAAAPEIILTAQPEPSSKPLVLVHISDLHFGTRPTKDGSSEPMHRFAKSDTGKTLVEHLVDELETFAFAPEQLHLVISGDLTYTATASEFKQAEEFIRELCAKLEIGTERVCIAPGNHDVSWPAATYEQARRFDRYLIFLRSLYGRETVEKIYPRIGWGLDAAVPVNGTDLFGIHRMADGALQIVTLNSCVHENEARHWGFVGETQLQKVGNKLPAIVDGSKTAVRVAVMHHHLHVFPEAQDVHRNDAWVDVSLARDAGAVERWLEEQRFSVLLHGHKHKPQLRETIIRGYRQNREEDARPLIVCGAGSASVHPRELEPSFGNHFEVIEILRAPRSPGADFLRVTWRELPQDSSVFWTKRPPWVIKG